MSGYKVGQEDVGQRIDIFLVGKLPKFSRSFIQKLCDTGKVTVNSDKVRHGYKLRLNEKVQIDAALYELQQTPDITLPVIYEDKDCIVVNKPSGVLTHSKGAFNPEATVATFIKDKVKGMAGERAGIVHRLDRGTSGVIICAKTPESLGWLQRQFSTRKVKKTYIAVVSGQLKEPAAVIDMPIERNPKQPKSFRVSESGRKAITQYFTETMNESYSLLKLTPQTGRTHQLRVHLSHLGHPIVGDTLYGGESADRLMLHAIKLELTLPSKKRVELEAPLPVEFNKYVSGNA